MDRLNLSGREEAERDGAAQPEVRESVRYEYDAKGGVLIRCIPGKWPQIIQKSELVWRGLDSRDDSYSRAIFLGQGCWESLDTVSEETARGILAQWGYSFPDAQE